MTEAYIVNGKRYNVHQRNLERFLKDHPTAVKEDEIEAENLPS